SYFFFFFQAEDGIRDFHVTGVQTCALPIYGLLSTFLFSQDPLLNGHAFDGTFVDLDPQPWSGWHLGNTVDDLDAIDDELLIERRSEERRVGKECRSRGTP